jgi:hypothetical protein
MNAKKNSKSARRLNTAFAGKPFDRMVANKQLTQDGGDWLTMALDPFHDWNQPIAGYPDADGSATIVQCFQYSTDISSPANAYDAHVFINPAFGYNDNNEVSVLGNEVYLTQTANDHNYTDGIISVVTADVNELLAPGDGLAYNPTNGSFATLGNWQDLVTPNSRVIGLGFEVINTTAEIYRQGTCTCYRMPESEVQTMSTVVNAANTASASMPIVKIREAPSNVASASYLHGTTQWAAAEGAYVVGTQQSIVNPITGVTKNPVLRTTSGYLANGEFGHLTKVSLDAATKPSTCNIPYAMKLIPFNISGVMMTGLSKETTLHIRLRVYVERAPALGANDRTLAVLATPSAAYDANCLKVYSEIVSRMPVACPVSMNAFADWWRVISGLARAVAVPVGTFFGGPAGAAFGAGIASTLTAADALWPTQPRPRNKQQDDSKDKKSNVK